MQKPTTATAKHHCVHMHKQATSKHQKYKLCKKLLHYLISSTTYKVDFICCKACHCNGLDTMWWIQASPTNKKING